MHATHKMTRKERVRAALAGQQTDRTPISFWHHFPGRDRTADDFAASTLEFQQRYDLDLLKLQPSGMACVLDYGATIAIREDNIGTSRVVSSPIKTPSDWARVNPAPVDAGENAALVHVVRRLRAAVGPDVPILQTLFSPLTIAHKLAGPAFVNLLGQDERAAERAIALFCDDVLALGKASLDAGADGFFFATQHAFPNSGLGREVFERLGAVYDLRILAPLAEDERNWCTILHLHGDDPYFELADRYPVHAVNWHDRDTSPNIREALGRTRRSLFAGIKRKGAVTTDDVQAVAAEVRDAIQQADGCRLVVAPGCVIPYTAPVPSLLAARRAVE